MKAVPEIKSAAFSAKVPEMYASLRRFGMHHNAGIACLQQLYAALLKTVVQRLGQLRPGQEVFLCWFLPAGDEASRRMHVGSIPICEECFDGQAAFTLLCNNVSPFFQPIFTCGFFYAQKQHTSSKFFNLVEQVEKLEFDSVIISHRIVGCYPLCYWAVTVHLIYIWR